MRIESMRYGRRAMGTAMVAAMCTVAAHAADTPTQTPTQKKPAAAKAAPTGTKKKGAVAPVACVPATENHAQQVCAPPAAQKFNTFEDIYAPATAVAVPASAEQAPATPAEKRE